MNSPSGQKQTDTSIMHLDEIRMRAEAARSEGRSVVVVQGLGFVGSAMAAVTASARGQDGHPLFFVIGVDLDSPNGREKIERVNRGLPVVNAQDPTLGETTQIAVSQLRSLVASSNPFVYELADVVVVDLPLDVRNSDQDADVDLAGYRSALRVIAEQISPETLVMIESTVPPGTTETVVYPLFQESFRSRGIDKDPLVSHSFERVMPGPRYVESIRSYWRCYAGCTHASAERTREFLERVIDVDRFPLTRLSSPRASEIVKVLENSYRAMNIAFIQEWTEAAESVDVDLFEVVRAIRIRKGTHDNIRQPGFGVGGYCLPKDGLLAEWGLMKLLGSPSGLPMTREAIRVNKAMPIHTLQVIRELLPDGIDGKLIGLAGVSYLAGVGDTRNSPAETFVDAAVGAGARIMGSDPLISEWPERAEVPLVPLNVLLREADIIVFTISHDEFQGLSPELFGVGKVIIDACGVITDEQAGRLRDSGHVVRGIGRGNWNTLEEKS